ncbi:MAG: hypothetical protein ACKVH0_06430, partial [Alphaproteobacteria bacterium]
VGALPASGHAMRLSDATPVTALTFGKRGFVWIGFGTTVAVRSGSCFADDLPNPGHWACG